VFSFLACEIHSQLMNELLDVGSQTLRNGMHILLGKNTRSGYLNFHFEFHRPKKCCCSPSYFGWVQQIFPPI
jgi:hypothetical protein